jgi:hypothetical protein
MPRPRKFDRMAADEADRTERRRLLEEQRRAIRDLETPEERAEGKQEKRN